MRTLKKKRSRKSPKRKNTQRGGFNWKIGLGMAYVSWLLKLEELRAQVLRQALRAQYDTQYDAAQYNPELIAERYKDYMQGIDQLRNQTN